MANELLKILSYIALVMGGAITLSLIGASILLAVELIREKKRENKKWKG